MPELDLIHFIAILFGAIAPNIIAGCKKSVDVLFEWAVLILERQKAKAKKKVDEIQNGE